MMIPVSERLVADAQLLRNGTVVFRTPVFDPSLTDEFVRKVAHFSMQPIGWTYDSYGAVVYAQGDLEAVEGSIRHFLPEYRSLLASGTQVIALGDGGFAKA